MHGQVVQNFQKITQLSQYLQNLVSIKPQHSLFYSLRNTLLTTCTIIIHTIGSRIKFNADQNELLILQTQAKLSHLSLS